MKQKTLHRYLLRKYVYAESAEEALSLDRKTKVRDILLQEEKPVQTEAIGFQLEE